MARLADRRIGKPKRDYDNRILAGPWPPDCSDLARDFLVPSPLHFLHV